MNKDVAIKKRQMITKANQSMMMSVAVASALVSAAIVGCFYISKIMFFNNKVIGEQDKSLSVLTSSINNIKSLQTSMSALQSNSALLSSRANPEDNALRVVLDALPSTENSAALGASLSDKLLVANGVKVESVTVDTEPTVVNIQSLSGKTASTSTSTSTSAPAASSSTASSSTSSSANDSNLKLKSFGFSASISSDDPQNILNVLKNLERSIRTINIKSLAVNISNEKDNKVKTSLTISAEAFFFPGGELELKDKVIKADETAKPKANSKSTTGGKK